MIWSGVLMVLGGNAGGACIPSNQTAGITALLVLTALSLVTMFCSIGKGLKILGNRDLSSGLPRRWPVALGRLHRARFRRSFEQRLGRQMKAIS